MTEKEIRLKDLKTCVEEGLDSQLKHMEYCQEIERLEKEISESKQSGLRKKIWINTPDGWKTRIYKNGP